VRRLGRRTVDSAGIERVCTGTDHFEREHVRLGMSPVSLRIVRSLDLPGIVERRRRNYQVLLECLCELAPPLLPGLPPGVCPLFYPLVTPDKDGLRARLAMRQIEAVNFWRHFHPACDRREFPDAAWLRDNVLEIPCHQDLREDVLEEVAREVVEAWRES
jgi:dTDP-4-amino-4,6-dideoxygalactose transaminase